MMLWLSSHSEFTDMSCYWCVADFRNWRYTFVRIWQTDRIAGGDWVTAGTYIFVSHWGSQIDCPSIVHVFSSTFHDFHSVFENVRMIQSGWRRVERNCKKVRYGNIFTCLNVVVCLEHEVQVSVCGCEVSLSLCLYLQMHTFERIDSLLLQQCNWCWHQHGDKSLQSAAYFGFDGSRVHYRSVCTLWSHWTYIVFYNSVVYDILTAGSSLITNAHHRTILWASIIQLVPS